MTDPDMFTEEQAEEIIAAFDTFLARWENLPPAQITIPFKERRMTQLAIPLDFYEKVLVECITRFVADWRKQNEIDPDDWPLELPLADWDEQFAMWCDTLIEDDALPA